MNKKLLTLRIVLVAGCLFLATSSLTSADKSADVPDELVIENEGYTKDKKGPVKLTHKAHSVDHKVKCADCHHEYKDGENVWKEGDPVKKCAECHDPEKKQDNAMKLQNAYHKNCKNCHKEIVKENPDSEAPFKKCNGCHEKKS